MIPASKFIDLVISVSKPAPWPGRQSFLTVVKFWMFGTREFEEILHS